MLKIIELGRKNGPDIIYLTVLCLIVRVKILLAGCLFGKMKTFKQIIPFLMVLLCLAAPNTFWAQDANWPWVFDGENFAITYSSQNSFSPSIASNDQIYFVVWHQKTGSIFNIYGARITKQGNLLDPGGIPICTVNSDQMYPSVAWDGVNFFVVWQDMRSGTEWDIYGARVDPEASAEEAVLDPSGIPIGVGKPSYDQMSPTLSFDGDNYLVVWQGKKNSKIWNICLSVVSKNGELINQNPIPLSPFSKNQVFPAVSFNGDSYFVVWQEGTSSQFWGIVGAIVFPIGEITDPEKIHIRDMLQISDKIQISPAVGEKVQWDRWRPEVSWNGRTHLITWISQRSKGQWSIESKRFDPIFWILDTVDLVLENDSTSNVFPAILWDDQEKEYLLFWEDDLAGSIYGASLQAQSQPFVVSDAVPISAPDANNPSMPGASRIEDEILIIWEGIGPGGNWQVYGQLLKRQVETPPVTTLAVN